MKTILLFLCSTILLFSTNNQSIQGVLKEGIGHDVVKQICTQCHSERTITPNRGDREDWEAIIVLMQSYGLRELTTKERETILNYLSMNYSNATFRRRQPVQTKWDKLNF
jgi:mono/diheme cytochrome c family protein